MDIEFEDGFEFEDDIKDEFSREEKKSPSRNQGKDNLPKQLPPQRPR
jgi:hypothetical protein